MTEPNTSSMLEPKQTPAFTPDFYRQLGDWLAAWADGRVDDQHGTYLNKVIATRAANPQGEGAAGRRRQNAAAVLKWVQAFTQGTGLPAYGAAGEQARELLDQYIADCTAAPVPPQLPDEAEEAAARTSYDDTLRDELRTMQETHDRLRRELSRAHDWRYHLEAQARAAMNESRRMAEAPRAPTQDALKGLSMTLREGIEWAP